MEPSKVLSGAYRNGTVTSWGGIPIRSDDGNYHLFVAQIDNNCTLDSWIPNSMIVHTVSANLRGPYHYVETVFETFHHNPTVRQLEDGSLLMYMIGADTPGRVCVNSKDAR